MNKPVALQPIRKGRRRLQQIIDTVTFPLRAVTLFHKDAIGLSSLATERFDYVSRYVQGFCLDIGCGPGNRFIKEFCQNHGVGVDVYPYEGLEPENIVQDPTHLPFPDETFDTVTFIANLNHVPEPMRLPELAEAFRVLRPKGNIIVTMGSPIAEILVHQLVALYDKVLGTRVDIDSERGMVEGETYYLTPQQICTYLTQAGFVDIQRRRFWTQWGLNSLYTAIKPG
ncbi:MAG: methyltransferase domain-containing protein [Thermogutta sp.]